MSMTHFKLRQLFKNFWEKRGHKEVPPISLVPKDDPTTLFTGSGMQQLVPYLLGKPHPLEKRLYNIQKCFRSQDIEEVGDLSHTTFFEMMGNWSLGDYFKEEQLAWFWEFLTKELKLQKEKLYVSVFAGTKEILEDNESYEIWKKLGVSENHIFKYGPDKNWWSRAGTPTEMPCGEPGGPDSEVFYDFGGEFHFHESSMYKDQICHPNCQCGRFLEIGNSVFMEYFKQKDGSFKELPTKNVDFGGGLERILAATNNNPDIFMIDVYQPLIKEIVSIYSGIVTDDKPSSDYSSYKLYEDKENVKETTKRAVRIIADHMKATTFLIVDGILPSNKEQGYVLRRLIRRAAVKMKMLKEDLNLPQYLTRITDKIIDIYEGVHFDKTQHCPLVSRIITDEINRFNLSLERGLQEIKKTDIIDGKIAFDLYQTHGFPLEITEELFREKGQIIDKKQFFKEFEKHKNLSRTASISQFKGGLADQSQQTIKYHTATHLLHQALFDILGDDIRQEGSNITPERLRFDFYSIKKPSEEEIKRVERLMNKKINEGLPVKFKIISKKEAEKVGAKSFFREKYPDMVKVYFIGNYSKEFCGGPHVKNTIEIGKIAIYKFKKIGSNLFRIYAKS